jgi:uncharacterized delta-60 repeat protein
VPTDGDADADADDDATIFENCGDGGVPGTLDETFGDGGMVWLKYAGAGASSISVQADGKIIVGGSTAGPNLALVRLLPDGSLDPSCGTGGLVERSFAGVATAYVAATAIQGDGRIVAVGPVRLSGQPSEFAALRYLPDGGADPSFGDAGVVLTGFASASASATSVVVQPDGRVLVGGYTVGTDYALARYNSDGSLDSSFGSGGRVVIDIHGTADIGGYVALATSAQIVVGGQSLRTAAGPYSDVSTARLSSSGARDMSFGSSGAFVSNVDAGSQSAAAILVDTSGRILLAGTFALAGADFGMWRLSPSGVPDGTFGDAGVVRTDFSTRDDEATAVLAQADGKLIVAGDGVSNASPSDSAIQLARHLPDGTLDPTSGVAGKTLTLPLSSAESYTIQAAALHGCGIVVAGTWTYDQTGPIAHSAMGIARYKR